MTAIYVWIMILGLAGLIDLVIITPTEEEKALSDLKAHKYAQARNYYWDEYNKGKRSNEIILPLSTLNENEGNLNESIRLMEGYVNDHPNDYFALRKLADLYRLNQYYEEYFNTLLKLQAMKEDWEVLQELSMWYRNTGQREALFKTLKMLIPTGHADDTDYLDLANLYAGDKNFEEAYRLLETRREYFIKKVTINDLLFGMWVAFELSKSQGGNPALEEQSIHQLAQYLIKLKSPKITYYAIGTVHENYPKYSSELITLLEPLIDHDPYLETLVLQTWWDTPEDKMKVPPRLKTMIKGERISPQLHTFAINVFLDQNEDDDLLYLIKNINAETVEDSEIYILSVNALTRNKPILAQKMQEALGVPFLKTHPMLDTALALGAQDPDGQVKLDSLIKAGNFIQSERFYFFKLALASNFEKEALELGEKLAPYRGLEDYMLLEVAQSYVQLKKQSELYSMIEKSIPPMTRSKAELPLAILDISTHKTLQVAKWMQTEKTIKENTLNAFFGVAESSKEYPFALVVARRMKEQYPSNIATANYGLALVQVGKFESGLELLRELYEDNPSNAQIEQAYFTAIAHAAKRDKDYHEELVFFMKDRENRGDVPLSLMRDFQYAYLDILHDVANAKRIVFILAQNAPPKSQDVETLIYLWGPKISIEQLAWIQKRVGQSKGKDLVHWMVILNYVGQPELAMQIFQRLPEEYMDGEAFLAYLDALTVLKMHSEMRCVIDQAIPHLTTRNQLERLAGYAEEAVYMEARSLAWKMIVSKEPHDLIAWQKLAKSTFDEHNYTDTMAILDHFFALDTKEEKLNPGIYESLYEYGISLKRHRHYDESDCFFRRAVSRINAVDEPTVKMLEIKALSLYELGKIKDALATLYDAFEKSSRDPETAASFANMLMGEGMLIGARNFLRCLYMPCTDNEEEQF